MIPSQLLPLANHLWQSTLFAAAVVMLTLFLRKNRAQVRYLLWLAASVKFLIPFSILMDAGSHFAQPSTAAISPVYASFVIEEVSTPFAVRSPLASIPPGAVSSSDQIPAILGNCMVARFRDPNLFVDAALAEDARVGAASIAVEHADRSAGLDFTIIRRTGRIRHTSAGSADAQRNCRLPHGPRVGCDSDA